MQVCGRCGKEYNDDRVFCDCGTRLALPPQDAATEVAELSQLVRGTMTSVVERVAALERARDEDALARQRIQLADGGSVTGLDRGGFSDFGEFLHACRYNSQDARLQALTPSATRDLSMGTGAAGGFLVPPQFAAMLLSITPQDAIVRPRAMVLPAGTSPDAPVTIPGDDQGGTHGVHSGVQVVWTGEGAAKHQTEPALREITLTPHEVSAYVTVTDKLLHNAAAASEWISTKLRGAIIAAEDVAFITGNGVGRPQGFLGHASALNVARAAPGAIAYADVVNMYAACLKDRRTGLVWIGNPTTLPSLMTMASVLGQLIWMPSARDGVPPNLLGIPFLENQRQPVLGTAGDLMLVNLGYYVIKDGYGLAIEASPHLLWRENKTIVRAVWNVDGEPSLATPLLLEDGVTQQSPFVVLN
jgi:HK97 family phage major capsid protein